MNKKNPFITQKLNQPIIINDGEIFEYNINSSLKPKKIVINGKIFKPVNNKNDLTSKTFFYDIKSERCFIMV
jgi:hypothetical protein